MFANEQRKKNQMPTENLTDSHKWQPKLSGFFLRSPVHTEVLYSVWLIWIKTIITPSLDDGDISLLRTEPSFARVSGRWRARICEDRSFQVEQAACARKNRHHSSNVITFVQGQKREHRLRRSRNTRNGNYNNAHVTQCKKSVEKSHIHTQTHTHKTNAQIHSHVMPLLRAWRPNGTFKKKKQANGSKQETEYKTANVTNSTQIWVICINGCSGTTAEPTLITWPCKTTHTKSGNNDDKPSGKWTRTVQQEITCRRYPPSLCLHDKSYPAVNILRIIELIVICSFSVWI